KVETQDRLPPHFALVQEAVTVVVLRLQIVLIQTDRVAEIGITAQRFFGRLLQWVWIGPRGGKRIGNALQRQAIEGVERARDRRIASVLIDEIAQRIADARRRRHIARPAKADHRFAVELEGESDARQEVVWIARPNGAIVLVGENPRAVVYWLV